MDTYNTKAKIFDVFYGEKSVTRSGGGTSKKKMCRLAVSNDKIKEVLSVLKSADNKIMIKYFEKLQNRDVKIAPPPRPKDSV